MYDVVSNGEWIATFSDKTKAKQFIDASRSVGWQIVERVEDFDTEAMAIALFQESVGHTCGDWTDKPGDWQNDWRTKASALVARYMARRDERAGIRRA